MIDPILEINYTDSPFPPRLQQCLADLANQVFRFIPAYGVWQLLNRKGESRQNKVFLFSWPLGAHWEKSFLFIFLLHQVVIWGQNMCVAELKPNTTPSSVAFKEEWGHNFCYFHKLYRFWIMYTHIHRCLHAYLYIGYKGYIETPKNKGSGQPLRQDQANIKRPKSWVEWE